MDPISAFKNEVKANVAALGADPAMRELAYRWMEQTSKYKYSYNYSWLGRPIIQFPEDIVALQELMWSVRPAVIVETGIAHGGSLILHASMLELLGGDGRVIGVDIDIRQHNRQAIEAHPLAKRIDLIEGASTDPATVSAVREAVGDQGPVVVILDSNHTHDHVRQELEAYSPLVGQGSYLVVFDTIIEFMPETFFADRPWSKGNNPWTAVQEFLAANDRFEVDRGITDKLLISVAPEGYLKCVKA